jgi:YD repeat-containing protein
MSLKIRLARGGSKKRPYYQIVVADASMQYRRMTYAGGRVAMVETNGGAQVSYTRDSFGRVTATRHATASSDLVESVTYDAAGRIATSTDTEGGVTRFTYDAPLNVLRWSVSLSGAAPDAVQAVVLRRTNATGTATIPAQSTRVIARLLGPGMHSASGTLTLSDIERRALADGRISLALYDRSNTATEVKVIR